MQTHSYPPELRKARRQLPGSVAFVPTMGFLHDGHLALMRRANELCDHLCVSIFVNPTQFGPGEDLDNYPRDLQRDRSLCEQLGCELLFTPTVSDIYADDHSTTVSVERLSDPLCGARRPCHFDGVATIVSALFHIVEPDVAVFGQKDYQQLAIIRRMVRDLHFPTRIDSVPIVREDDGLALSSRNRYLTSGEREQATSLSRGLVAAHRAFHDRQLRAVDELKRLATAPIDAQPDTAVDYLQLVDPHTLEPFTDDQTIEASGAVLALAVHLGDARLIDNLRLDEPLPPGLHHVLDDLP